MPVTPETVIVSDLHLCEAQEPDPKRPLWMAYKRREFFVDESFADFLTFLEERIEGPIELVLNGDIFDFDAITALPEGRAQDVSWLARARGLASEQWMSEFKMQVMIDDHRVWFDTIRDFVGRGHRVVFVIGNHDAELCWPSVQRMINERIGAQVVFCEWFYVSGEDTYISHGHQYDPNCTSRDPIHPLIQVHGRPRVRIPFGDLAARYMLNGMGYFNPHAPENYIMSATQYFRFFVRYMLRTQPLLIWTWFWGAVATLFVSLRDHWRHPMRDPLLIDEKVQSIAERAQATPAMVRKLNAVHVPSATDNPLQIARELWLDRAFLLLGGLFLAWQVVLHINIAVPISPFWVFVPMAILLFPYLAYASSVKPTAFATPLLDEKRAELIYRITGAHRIVFGHTHEPECEDVGPVAFFNSGFWSAAFAEPECIHQIGGQTFVWIHRGDGARAGLYEWKGDEKSAVAICEKRGRPSLDVGVLQAEPTARSPVADRR